MTAADSLLMPLFIQHLYSTNTQEQGGQLEKLLLFTTKSLNVGIYQFIPYYYYFTTHCCGTCKSGASFKCVIHFFVKYITTNRLIDITLM